MWSLLRKLIGWPSKEELEGIALCTDSFWEVSAPSDHCAFVRRLTDLLPEGAVLYLEGTTAREVIELAESREPKQTAKVARGTIWPKPRTLHLNATRETLDDLASIMERHVEPEVCIHLHAYKDDKVLLQWHDAFWKDPLLIAPQIPEGRIKELCESLGCSCTFEREDRQACTKKLSQNTQSPVPE